jgi:hypothetical protein
MVKCGGNSAFGGDEPADEWRGLKIAREAAFRDGV